MFDRVPSHLNLSMHTTQPQAQEVLRATGQLTPERKAYLDDMRKQLQLPEDKADKIIREVRRLSRTLPDCTRFQKACLINFLNCSSSSLI